MEKKKQKFTEEKGESYDSMYFDEKISELREAEPEPWAIIICCFFIAAAIVGVVCLFILY